MKNALTIGMIGGMSWESSALYYRLANEMVRDRLGGLHSAKCIIFSVDFAEIEGMQVRNEWDRAGAVLAEAAQSLQNAGADLLVLCTNTMHKVADQISTAVSIPLLHLADATADAVLDAGLTTIGLLGTAFTMEEDFYVGRLVARGLTVLTPTAPDRDRVHHIIYDELCLGVVRSESRVQYQHVMAELIERGAEGIILGCTEIELLIAQSDCPVKVFPTTRIHVEAAVAASLELPLRN